MIIKKRDLNLDIRPWRYRKKAHRERRPDQAILRYKRGNSRGGEKKDKIASIIKSAAARMELAARDLPAISGLFLSPLYYILSHDTAKNKLFCFFFLFFLSLKRNQP